MKNCPKCHSFVAEGSDFCGTCGHDMSAANEDEFVEKLTKLSQLKEA